MANAQIKTKTGNVIEVAWGDILSFLNKAQQIVVKGPQVIAGVTVILQAVDKVVADGSLDVSNPVGIINIPMDVAQFQDVKAVWEDVKSTFKI